MDFTKSSYNLEESRKLYYKGKEEFLNNSVDNAKELFQQSLDISVVSRVQVSP